MASGVIVPVHVAAVCMGTRTGTDAAQLGMADFSRLAYFKDDNYDYPDPAGPYTSGECLQETTGYLSTGVHLHFELIKNKKPIDPYPLLRDLALIRNVARDQSH